MFWSFAHLFLSPSHSDSTSQTTDQPRYDLVTHEQITRLALLQGLCHPIPYFQVYARKICPLHRAQLPLNFCCLIPATTRNLTLAQPMSELALAQASKEREVRVRAPDGKCIGIVFFTLKQQERVSQIIFKIICAYRCYMESRGHNVDCCPDKLEVQINNLAIGLIQSLGLAPQQPRLLIGLVRHTMRSNPPSAFTSEQFIERERKMVREWCTIRDRYNQHLAPEEEPSTPTTVGENGDRDVFRPHNPAHCKSHGRKIRNVTLDGLPINQRVIEPAWTDPAEPQGRSRNRRCRGKRAGIHR